MSTSRSPSRLPQRLKMRQVALLLELVERRSIVHAAEVIGISQPAASRLLADLEDSLGVSLFERHARGVVPTAYGDLLVRHLRGAISEIERADSEIAALKSGLQGTVAVGTVVTPATGLVPRAVARLKKDHPRLLVRIERDHSDVLVERLLRGDLDLAVARIGATPESRELAFVPLGEEPQSVIVRAGHPLLRRRGLRIEDLAEQAWILPPRGTALRLQLDAMFMELGCVPPMNVVEATSLMVALSLLPISDMLVSLPAEAVRPFFTSGLVAELPIRLPVRMDAYGVITRRGRTVSPGMQLLLDALRDAARAGRDAVASTSRGPSRRRRRTV